jgi:hypothetical protein
MKMLFFSSELAEIEAVQKNLMEAGIICLVRDHPELVPTISETEVWLQNDEDTYRAVLLCVELGVGFARRPKLPQPEDSADERENEERQAEAQNGHARTRRRDRHRGYHPYILQ